MIIRQATLDDIESVKKIHEKYFNHEFTFEEFNSGYISSFLVEDESGIISAGGVRTLFESVIVTDKSRSRRDRKEALFSMLRASIQSLPKSDYNQLHAFVQDE